MENQIRSPDLGPLSDPLLVCQGLGLPAGTQLNGSLRATGGEAAVSGALASPGQTASLTLVAAVHPSEATLRVRLSHTLPTLRAIPPEALLSVQLGWAAGHRLGLELQAEACELQGGGELRLDHGLHWWVLAESSCEALQVRGASVWRGGRPHSLQGAGRGLLFNHWRNKRD